MVEPIRRGEDLERPPARMTMIQRGSIAAREQYLGRLRALEDYLAAIQRKGRYDYEAAGARLCLIAAIRKEAM